MFFNLKRGLMKRSIEKRNLQHPFDYEYAEHFSLKGITDPFINNSYYFSAHSGEMSIFIRLGKRIHQDETWFALYRGGKVYSLKEEFFPAGKAPIQVEKVDGNWTVSFEGLLNGTEKMSFRGKFIAREKPINFSSDVPAIRMATGVANEKWSKDFFAQLQTISGQCHYEQEGTLEGCFTLADEKVDFSMPCVRDHSYGKRDWDYMNNHLWLMGVSKEAQFNYSVVSYPALSALETGNYRDEKGLHFMVKANLDFHLVNKGTIPQELSLGVTLNDGRTIPVQAKVLATVSYHFQEGAYALHENIAAFTIDGKTIRGILEIGFNRNSSRYFNNRDLESIKR